MIARFDYNGYGEAFLTIGDKEWDTDDATKIGLQNLGLPEDLDEMTDTYLAATFAGWRHLLATHPITAIEDSEAPEGMTVEDTIKELDRQIHELLQ